jgi:peptidoglycan-associated lipoprotein
MRFLFALPFAVLFGCAHETSATDQAAAAHPVAQAQPMTSSQSESASIAAAPAPATAKPTPVAGASPQSNPATCGLVHVRFDTDSATLRDDDKALLGATADCLRQNQALRISVEGNADERGPSEHNTQLGHERAQAVAQYLESQGVSSAQLQQQVSFGDQNPVCTESNEDCWQKNRRTAVRPTCHM